jgi:hypothetical protein
VFGAQSGAENIGGPGFREACDHLQATGDSEPRLLNGEPTSSPRRSGVYMLRLLLWLLQSCVRPPERCAVQCTCIVSRSGSSCPNPKQAPLPGGPSDRLHSGIWMAVRQWSMAQVRLSGSPMCNHRDTKAVCGGQQRCSDVRAPDLAGVEERGTQEGGHRGCN